MPSNLCLLKVIFLCVAVSVWLWFVLSLNSTRNEIFNVNRRWLAEVADGQPASANAADGQLDVTNTVYRQPAASNLDNGQPAADNAAHGRTTDNNAAEGQPASGNAADLQQSHSISTRSAHLIATRPCTQQERKKHVTDMCRKFKDEYHPAIGIEGANSDTDGGNHIVVGDANKVAWCRVPKVATLTMTGLISAAQGIPKKDTNAKQNIDWLGQYNLKLVVNKSIQSFHGYKKLLIVRNPYNRIVSAFIDKIHKTHATHPIMQKARRKVQEFEGHNTMFILNGQTFTAIKFENFLSQIVLSSDPLRWNAHWTEITALCDVCAEWDYILKLETLDSDINLLLDGLNVTGKFFRKISSTFSSKKNENAVQNDRTYLTFMSDLSLLANISEQSLNGLKQRYGRDAALFGYDVNEDTYTGTCGFKTDAGDVCC